jgi:two-component system, sensor histidine kinase
VTKRILIVDDHQLNRTLLSAILSKFNLAHDFAENGEEAINMVESVQYDVVLMDIFMPKMNGFQSLDIIKSHHNSTISKIPVIAVTAQPELKGLDQFDDLIPKPINIKNCHDTLAKFIKITV